MRCTPTIPIVLMLFLAGLVAIVPAGDAALPPPQADAGPDQTVSEDDTVTLDGSNSRDLTPGEDLTFEWDFDSSNGSNDVDARGEVVTTKYKDSGVYTVTLTVSDGDYEDTDTCRITVLPANVDNVPPKAIIRSPLPGTFNVSESITFEGTGFDADGDSLTGKWEFGDGATAQGSPVTHSYGQEGAKHIRWIVNDGKANNTAHTVIYIGETPNPELNRRPDADINASKTNVTVGERIRFSAANSSDPDGDDLAFTWDWDVSDGLQDDATNEVVFHRYNESGEYTVSLRVTDNNPGGFAIATETIRVNDRPNDPPVVNAGNDAEVQVGVSLTFRGTANDPDGDNITLYAWDFGDGFTWESNETGQTTHAYGEPGTYTATFTAEDEREESASDTRTVVVNPPPDMPPTADAGEDMTLMEGQRANFDGRGTDDFGIAKYQWDFTSDGVWDYESTRSGDTQHTYDEPGIYSALLRVTDKPRPGVPGDGQTAEDTVIVTVLENEPPTAKIVLTSLYVQTGELVRFRSDSSDPEGSSLDYAWDLDGDMSVDSISSSPSWVYKREGKYPITLTVTDDFGQSATDTETLDVSQSYAVELDVSSGVREMEAGESHQFRFTVSNEGNGDDQIRISLSGDNSAWGRLDVSVLNLNASERQTLTLTVTVPENARSTDEAIITVTAESNYGSTSDADEVIVTVRQQFDVQASIDTGSIVVNVGDTRDSVARVSITNKGNGPDSFRITFSGDITAFMQASTPKVDLGPGETKSVTLSVAVGDSAPAGQISGKVLISSTKSSAKQQLDFSLDIEGGTGGGTILPEFLNDWRIITAIVVVIAVLAGLAVTAGRRKGSGKPRPKKERTRKPTNG